MSSILHSGRRSATSAVLLMGGGALAVATWIGGQHGLAVGLIAFYVVVALVAYAWAGRDTDAAAALRSGGDERQRRLDRDATAIAGLAMVVLAIVGGIVSAAANGGDLGVFGLFAAVGGLAYIVAFVVLSRRS